MASPTKEFTSAELEEIHALPDDALIDLQAAAAVLNITYATITWYRCKAPELLPSSIQLGRSKRGARYRMGDLRAFIATRRCGGGQ